MIRWCHILSHCCFHCICLRIAFKVLIHVFIGLSDVHSHGGFSKFRRPLPVVIFVFSFSLSTVLVWSSHLFLIFDLHVFPNSSSQLLFHRSNTICIISLMPFTFARGITGNPFSTLSLLIAVSQSSLILPLRKLLHQVCPYSKTLFFLVSMWSSALVLYPPAQALIPYIGQECSHLSL